MINAAIPRDLPAYSSPPISANQVKACIVSLSVALLKALTDVLRSQRHAAATRNPSLGDLSDPRYAPTTTWTAFLRRTIRSRVIHTSATIACLKSVPIPSSVEVSEVSGEILEREILIALRVFEAISARLHRGKEVHDHQSRLPACVDSFCSSKSW